MSKHNTIGKGESQRAINGGLDKYYTKQYIADYYSHIVLERFGSNQEYIEPTAGNGSFMKVIPNIKGFDLEPENENIIQANIFENEHIKKNQIAIGNPPFGMNASMAQKIFNHLASKKVKAICFILPKTFKKDSLQNKLDLNYHLTFEQDVVKNAFTVEGKDKHVPCVFQIWEYKNTKREPTKREDCKWIEFVTKENADIAVRRAGGRAGQLLDGTDHTESSTYFIKIKDEKVITAIKLIDRSVIENTAGVHSISKAELCSEINRIMEIIK